MIGFFEEGKDIFIKLATVFKELKPRMKFVFYQIYGDRVLLTKDVLREYVRSQDQWCRKGSRKKKKWLVIELEDISRLSLRGLFQLVDNILNIY